MPKTWYSHAAIFSLRSVCHVLPNCVLYARTARCRIFVFNFKILTHFYAFSLCFLCVTTNVAMLCSHNVSIVSCYFVLIMWSVNWWLFWPALVHFDNVIRNQNTKCEKRFDCLWSFRFDKFSLFSSSLLSSAHVTTEVVPVLYNNNTLPSSNLQIHIHWKVCLVTQMLQPRTVCFPLIVPCLISRQRMTAGI